MTRSSYTWLSAVYKKYKDQGLEVIAFPCNQFGGQEPWDEPKIKEFVQRFDVKFRMFSKIDVKGPNAHPVYQFLTSCYPGEITWNFASKFVVDHHGIPSRRFEKEKTDEMEKYLVELLRAAKGERESESATEAASAPSNSSL